MEARTGDPEQAERHIVHWDELTRKLEAGAYIRGVVITREATAFGKEFRQTLDDLRHAVDDGEKERIEEYVAKLLKMSQTLAGFYQRAPRRSWASLFPADMADD